MDKMELLLIVNSVLLGFVSILIMVVSYFLKDLHKDFKQLVERVNKVSSDVSTHVNLFDRLSQVFQRQIDNLFTRVYDIEQNGKAKQHEKK